MLLWTFAVALLALLAARSASGNEDGQCSDEKYWQGSEEQEIATSWHRQLTELPNFQDRFNETARRKLAGRSRKVVVKNPLPVNEGACPSTETVPAFHNLLTLPKRFVPHKISFRSCIEHVNETVIADISGPGAVMQFWLVTGIGGRRARPKHCVYTNDALTMTVRVYVDGETTPRIQSPLGPLFGIHHDMGDNWGSTNPYGADNNMYKISENGGFTLVAPMPYKSGIRITIQDETPDKQQTMRIWAQVSYHAYDPRCPMPETMRLHAVYRIQDRIKEFNPPKEKPSHYKRSYVVGHGQGKGYLLGATFGFSLADRADWWFHNSGELIILDHQTNPHVMKGTGGEDTFCSSCWFNEHHNYPDWGYQSGDNTKQFSAYRWFIGDMKIPFESSFQFQYGLNRDFVASTMYWYQEGPAIPVNKHIPLAQRLRQEPVDPLLRVDPPTGEIAYWNYTPLHSLSHWSSSHLEVPVHFDEWTFIKPSFGFATVGEYFFDYGRGNEGYPGPYFLWMRSYYNSPNAQDVRIMVTHDDRIEVFLNDYSIYSFQGSVPGYHTVDIYTTLDAGQNTFIVKLGNDENNNARAFALGFNLFLGEKEPVSHYYRQEEGRIIDTSFACD